MAARGRQESIKVADYETKGWRCRGGNFVGNEPVGERKGMVLKTERFEKSS